MFVLYVLAYDTVVQVFTARESVVLPNIARFGLAYGASSTKVFVSEYSVTSMATFMEGMELLDLTTGRTTVEAAGSATHTVRFAN